MGYGAYHETVESAREAMRSTRAVNAGMFARNDAIAHGGQKGIHPMLDIRRPNGRQVVASEQHPTPIECHTPSMNGRRLSKDNVAEVRTTQ